MDDGFGHWLAGFIDGEGCFIVAESSNGRGHFYCRFSLKLRYDDAEILREIQAQLGIGTISKPRLDFGSEVLRGKPSIRWTVSDKAGCLALVKVLDRYPLRAKKARDYAIWRDAAVAWASVTRANERSPQGALARNAHVWAEMKRARERLKIVRIYSEEPLDLSDLIVEGPAQLFTT